MSGIGVGTLIECHRGTWGSGAVFSPDGVYRYTLWRRWSNRSLAMFIGLNPSTADETTDDPTVRRCIGFAKSWGYGGVVMTNLFALRATDPRVMLAHPNPVGPENDRLIVDAARDAEVVVAAWGCHGPYRDRAREVRRRLHASGKLSVLALTKAGEPRHPLYLKGDLKPMPYGDMILKEYDR